MSESGVSEDFDAAATCVASLAAKGHLEEPYLLQLYGLYKQSTEGPCSTKCPSIFDFKGRAKWMVWNELGEMSSASASREYVGLLTQLLPDWKGSEGETREKSSVVGAVFSSLAHGVGPSQEVCCISIRIPNIFSVHPTAFYVCLVSTVLWQSSTCRNSIMNQL